MNTAPAHHILVVDDDPDLRDLLQSYLSNQGLRVSTAGDGVQMRAALADGTVNALVLDLMLPGEDGLALTRAVRAQSNLPILMLSARGEEIDRVVGLEVGADDYLPKPFSPRELLARLRALLRRGQSMAPSPPEHLRAPSERPAPSTLHRFGDFRLDTAGHTLHHLQTEVPLTPGEFDLLAVLVTHPNRVLSRDTLVDLLRGLDRDPFDRSVDNRVTRLRRKIEADPANPRFIRTVRGEGYLFNPGGASV